MIPLRDAVQSRNYPVVNTILIGLNVLIFLVEKAQGPELQRFIVTYGLVPARYSMPEISAYFSVGQQILSFFSFMFLHGGFWHLLGNMWTLYIFGDNVEDRLGPFRYILFYLLCGWASGLFHLFLNWQSPIPTIGASGAIAGVMGAYFLLHPRARILALIPIFFIPFFTEIPAFVFLGIWFIIQFLSAAGSHGQTGGIAWWAHVGGFISGMILLKAFLKLPNMGMTKQVRSATAKKRSPRIRVIPPQKENGDPHLYGTVDITPIEASLGTRKLVNLPWGFGKRLIRVTVPPGVKEGTVLRLGGLGKPTADGKRGDFLLKIRIHSQ
jgi:membrane associated rhomboid family serine protease